jgi:pimeloyl-ACP methyl ester carboxylesterase
MYDPDGDMTSPLSMRMRTVDAGGPVHFADFGGSGSRLVLVHGLGGSHANWLAVAPRLAERAQVVAPDLPGFGRTPPAGRSARVPVNRECLHRFLAEVGRPAVLVGNSMGGLIAMMEAALHPENVSALVLVAPAQPTPVGTRIDREILLAFAIYSIPWVGEWYLRRRAARLGPEGFVREVLRLLCVDPSRVPDHVRRAHVALAAERLTTMPDAHRTFLEAARSLLGVLRRRGPYDEMVGRIAAPTLLIQGTQDRLVSLAASQALARKRPDWAFEVFEDVGHVPQLEAPTRFVDVVESWLERVGRVGG